MANNNRRKAKANKGKAKTQSTPQAPKSPRQTDRLAESPQKSVQAQSGGSSGTRIRPERMSLTAHSHVQAYINQHQSKTNQLTKDEVTAVLRLRQHLRVFGLLSAVGFVNQSNQQEGKVSGITNQVWQVLLNKLVDENNALSPTQLMERVQTTAQNQQTSYMVLWRRSLKLSHYWNFWAKAYQEEKKNEQTADVSNHSTADRTAGETTSRALSG